MNSKNIYQRLNDVMTEVTSVFKGTQVSMGGSRSYSAVSHDDVTSLIHEPLTRNGIFVEIDTIEASVESFETVTEYQGKSQVKIGYLAKVLVQATFVNIDDPKDRFSVKKFAYAMDSSDKAVGKAESMAVKYIYLKNLLLESTDDEESRSFENLPKHTPPAKTGALATPPAAETSAPPAASRGSFKRNAATQVAQQGDL
jgi:hypothetical protein